MGLGPTHEEVWTALAPTLLRCPTRQLPVLPVYQIQTQIRDEIRPRFRADLQCT